MKTGQKTHLKIDPNALVDMSADEGALLYRIELAYARDDNLLFEQQIYRVDAHLWLHQDLAAIVISAARDLSNKGYRLVLYDGLRTVDAQERMLTTQKVRDNPNWLEKPRLLSPPGAGAHPRGMAIDVSIETLDGTLLNMGTAFDFLSADPSPHGNPAHREYINLSDEVRANRAILDTAMKNASESLSIPLWSLPQEWWDFRLPEDISDKYAPLRDADLPPAMRMVS